MSTAEGFAGAVMARGPRLGRPFIVQQMRIKSIDDDTLVCRTYNGKAEGSSDVIVAKPYLLRRTPFDGKTRNGITYTYTSATSRSATDGTIVETQIVIANYVVDDLIYAGSGITGGAGVTFVSGARTLNVNWIDINLDGRFWAKTA